MSESLFIRDCYLQTSWLPLPDLSRQVGLGDVLQILPGRVAVLASLANVHLAQAAQLSPELPLLAQDFRLQSGVTNKSWQRYNGDDDTPGEIGYCRAELEFGWPGSYLFQCQRVNAQYLLNWQQLRDDFTLKLTQMHYQFRQVCVVTAVARAEDWELSIAAQAQAHQVFSSELSVRTAPDILSGPKRQLEASQGMAVHQSSQHLAAHFIQAKCLILSELADDKFLNQIVEAQVAGNAVQRANWLHADKMNLFRNAELNLTSCKDFFSWRNLTLDDVEVLIK